MNAPGEAVLAAWRARGCLIGTSTRPCGGPVFGAYAVQTYSDAHAVESDAEPTPNVLLVCRPHFEALQLPAPIREVPP